MKLIALLLSVLAVTQALDGVWTEITPTGDIPIGRGSPVKIEMGGPNIYIFGGLQELGSGANLVNVWYNDLYNYNLNTHVWTQIDVPAPVPAARAFSTGWKVDSDSFMICGGGFYTATFSTVQFFGDFWRYEISSNTWTQVFPTGDPLPASGLLGLGSVQVSDTIVYLWGGIQLAPGFTDAIPVLYRYNIATNSLTKLNPPGENPFGHHPVLFATTAGFRLTFRDVLGPDPLFPTNWEYRIDTNEWVPLTSINQPITRQYYDGDLYGNLHIGYGGDLPDGNIESEDTVNETYAYSISRDAWKLLETQGNPPGLKRQRMVRFGNAIYMVLGYTVDESTNFERAYLTQTWKLQPNVGTINSWFNKHC